MSVACCSGIWKRYSLTEKIADCLHDPRENHKVKPGLLTLVCQRLCAIAQGYQDANDAGVLAQAQDPAFKIIADGSPESAGALASQPTLSRFENRADTKDRRRLSEWLLALYLKTRPGPRQIFPDLDETCDPTHGEQ